MKRLFTILVLAWVSNGVATGQLAFECFENPQVNECVKALAVAVEVGDPAGVANAIAKLESFGARVPALPYLQLLDRKALNMRLAPRFGSSLCKGLAVAFWGFAGLSLLRDGRAIIKGDDGVSRRTCRLWIGAAQFEKGEHDRSIVQYGGTAYEPLLGWRERLVWSYGCASAALFCTWLGWCQTPLGKYQAARLKEIACLLVASPSLIIGDDEEKVAAILKKLDIDFMRTHLLDEQTTLDLQAGA